MTQNWRTDVENAPKDGTPFLVIDPFWENQNWCKYSMKIVSWQKINNNDTLDRFGWSYSYDYEYLVHQCVDDFKYWMEIPKL
jgi:hypothetical protein